MATTSWSTCRYLLLHLSRLRNHFYRLGRRHSVFLSPSSPRSVSTSTSLTSPHHLRLFIQPRQLTTLKRSNFLYPPHSCQLLLLHVLSCDAFLNSSPLFLSCVTSSYLKIAPTETPKKLVPFSCFLNCPLQFHLRAHSCYLFDLLP